MAKKKIEDLNEEVKEVKAKKETVVEEEHCDCDHELCDCGCGDFEFFDDVVPHKKGSFANILSIVSKVLGLIFFILGTWNFGEYMIQYTAESASYGGVDIIGAICSYFTSILLVSVAFLAIGEGINLLNRMKESLY